MNCITGDIAIVIKSNIGNLGKIVKCLQFVGDTVPGHSTGPYKDVWLVDRELAIRKNDDIIYLPYVPDFMLRPLRDSDGEDEMLRITGLPVLTDVDIINSKLRHSRYMEHLHKQLAEIAKEVKKI